MKIQKATEIEPNQYHNILLLGGTGGGKTTQIHTLPGRTLAFVFDPSALPALKQSEKIDYLKYDVELLDLNIYTLAAKAPNTYVRGKTKSDVYERFAKDFIECYNDKGFDPYDNIAFDSLTTFQAIIMDQVIALNGRAGQAPQQDDYTPAMTTIMKFIRTLCAYPKNTLIIGHDLYEKDETTSRLINQPILFGKLRGKLPILFNHIFRCECVSTKEEIKYQIQTRPDRANPTIRTCIENLGMFEDVTIRNWAQPEAYGLGKLFKKKELK